LDSFIKSDPKQLFKVFHLIFKKEYNLNSVTAIERYKIFKQNLNVIKEHNNKNLSWWYSVNEYTDLTDEEFNTHFNIKPHDQNKINDVVKNQGKFLRSQDVLEKSLSSDPKGDTNWLSSLTPVRNQGDCGSCWAHATVGAIESAYGIKNGKVIDHLSPQQLVDCSMMTNGCKGGWPEDAYSYVQNSGGVMSERDYPYLGVQGQCKFNQSAVSIKLKTYNFCLWCQKNGWRNLLGQGSISVLVTSQDILKNYGGGVINLSGYKCSYSDHVVLAYGWKTSQDGSEIISLRNSWGENWGDKGNFHVYYSEKPYNTCWITKQGFLPVV